jgi:Ca2+-dependent lipid-binding protein
MSQPDYQRAAFINTIMELLWPHLGPAIHTQVVAQAKAPIDEAVKKFSFLKEVRIDRLDLGQRPFRLDSFKTFETSEDEVIIEVGSLSI